MCYLHFIEGWQDVGGEEGGDGDNTLDCLVEVVGDIVLVWPFSLS